MYFIVDSKLKDIQNPHYVINPKHSSSTANCYIKVLNLVLILVEVVIAVRIIYLIPATVIILFHSICLPWSLIYQVFPSIVSNSVFRFLSYQFCIIYISIGILNIVILVYFRLLKYQDFKCLINKFKAK